MSRPAVLVTGGFDDLRLLQVRFLQESSRLGEVTVLLWTDAAFAAAVGCAPKSPLAERRYLLDSLRFVSTVRFVLKAAGLYVYAGQTRASPSRGEVSYGGAGATSSRVRRPFGRYFSSPPRS